MISLSFGISTQIICLYCQPFPVLGYPPLTNSAKICVKPRAGLPAKGRRDSNSPWGKTQQHLFRFTLCLLPVVILFGFEFVPHALAFQRAAIFLPVPSFDERLTAGLTKCDIGFAAVVLQSVGVHRHKSGKSETGLRLPRI